MSELSIGKKLEELARVHAATSPVAPPVEGLAALLELGRLVEAEPDAAGCAVAGLSTAEAETLLQWAQGERQEDVAFLRTQLASVIDHLELLDLPPILADDPDAAESALAQALATLYTRERIHQLGVAATWLQGEADSPSAQGGGIGEIDEHLRKIVPLLSVLAPERARQAAEVAPDDQAAHWWWTAPCPEAPDTADHVDADAVAQLQRWVASRIVASPAGSRLQLDADEAAALLATPRGQRLAAYLGDRLDFDLALAAPAGTAAEVLTGNSAMARPRSGQRIAPVIELWRPRAQPRTERLAAATDGDPVLAGLDALAGVYCHAAELLPGLGVVAHGSRACDGERQRVWLIVAESDVATLQVSGEGALWSKERWSPGGLAVAADPLSEPFEVIVTRAASADASDSHHWVETGPEDVEPNLLTRLLRNVYGEQFEAARRDWAELVAESYAESVQALSGLRLALAALCGGDWP